MLTETDLRLALERYFPNTEISVRHDTFGECFDVRFVWRGQSVVRLIPEAQMLNPGDEIKVAERMRLSV